jgi:hypothetical protein
VSVSPSGSSSVGDCDVAGAGDAVDCDDCGDAARLGSVSAGDDDDGSGGDESDGGDVLVGPSPAPVVGRSERFVDREPASDAAESSVVCSDAREARDDEGLNWNLLPPQSGQPESISFEPSANVRPQVVHWWGIGLLP